MKGTGERRMGGAAGVAAMLLLLAAGCGDAGDGTDGPTTIDPFAGLGADGKADSGAKSFFAPGQVHRMDLDGPAGAERLAVAGPHGAAVYQKLTVAVAPAPAGARAAMRVLLYKHDALAGMDTVNLVPADDDGTRLRLFLGAQLAAQVGIIAPRVTHAHLFVNGQDRGPFAVVEHVDSRFLKDRFGTDAGRVYRTDEVFAGDDVNLLAARLKAVPYPGRRALASVVAVETLVDFVALAAAVGGSLDRDPSQPPPLAAHLYNGCGDEAPCFAIIPSWDGGLFGLATPATVTGLGVSPWLHELRDRLLRLPELRGRYLERLTALSACLAEPVCSREPALRQAAALASLAGAESTLPAAVQGELFPRLDAQVAAVESFAERERTLDAPDGYPDYASFARADDGSLTVAFRHLSPGQHAARVWLRVSSGARAEERLPMERDLTRDLWTVLLEAGAGQLSYRFEVETADGATLLLADPARPLPAGAQGDQALRLDLESVDALQPLTTFKVPFDEPSDLVFGNGSLYAVSDRHDNIYRLDPGTGALLDKIDVRGADLEAVGFDPLLGQFLLADESRHHVWRIDTDGEVVDSIDVDKVEDGNSGIEGLALRHEDGHLFVAKEKSPDRIIELDDAGQEVRRQSIGWADDLSALAWNADDAHLYALSQEDQTLFRLGADLSVQMSWRLDVPSPEGIAFDGAGRLYVASDSKARVQVFAFNAWRNQ